MIVTEVIIKKFRLLFSTVVVHLRYRGLICNRPQIMDFKQEKKTFQWSSNAKQEALQGVSQQTICANSSNLHTQMTSNTLCTLIFIVKVVAGQNKFFCSRSLISFPAPEKQFKEGKAAEILAVWIICFRGCICITCNTCFTWRQRVRVPTWLKMEIKKLSYGLGS